jgi:hypothetical protein
MIKRIHVNQHNIRANSKGEDLPVFTVKTYKENLKGERVVIKGDSELVYSPDKPLDCGAKVWIETTADVDVFFGNWKVTR